MSTSAAYKGTRQSAYVPMVPMCLCGILAPGWEILGLEQTATAPGAHRPSAYVPMCLCGVLAPGWEILGLKQTGKDTLVGIPLLGLNARSQGSASALRLPTSALRAQRRLSGLPVSDPRLPVSAPVVSAVILAQVILTQSILAQGI